MPSELTLPVGIYTVFKSHWQSPAYDCIVKEAKYVQFGDTNSIDDYRVRVACIILDVQNNANVCRQYGGSYKYVTLIESSLLLWWPT